MKHFPDFTDSHLIGRACFFLQEENSQKNKICNRELHFRLCSQPDGWQGSHRAPALLLPLVRAVVARFPTSLASNSK